MSFYVGPSFTVRQIATIDGAESSFQVQHDGKVVGFINALKARDHAGGNFVIRYYPRRADGSSEQMGGACKSVRQAGIAVLRAAGVRSPLQP